MIDALPWLLCAGLLVAFLAMCVLVRHREALLERSFAREDRLLRERDELRERVAIAAFDRSASPYTRN